MKGDIILDGFSGSGMSGVAASEENRKAILIDLAPISTFITSNYNSLNSKREFQLEFSKILNDVTEELGWLYETNHIHTINNTQKDIFNKDFEKNKGVINYTIWSDIFSCPYCSHEFDFFSVDNKKDEDKGFSCPSCKAYLKKDNCIRVKELIYDSLLLKEIEINKQKPVLINYTYNKKRFEKIPDDNDIELLRIIESTNSSYWIPAYKMLFKDGAWGDIYRTGYHYGVTHSHHFYTKRNLLILSAFWNKAKLIKTKWMITSIINYVCKKQSYSGGGGGMPGVLFIASLVQEKNVIDVIKRKAKKIIELLSDKPYQFNVITSNQSVTGLSNLKENSVDYIFTDPPFGDNIMYSEASFLWESWLKVFTNNDTEAIINNSQQKNLSSYYYLMHESFKQYYKVLKPKRWITVKFHNSKSSVWNSIQEAIIKAGFVIAQVSVLDKKQGSFKQVTSSGAVKSDLVISAYKPSKKFEDNFLKNGGEGLELDFVQEFLQRQPIRPVLERTEKMLYSKMLSYYIQHGYEVRYDATTFYQLLHDNFADEDGYWFNAGQINSYLEYKKKMKLEGIDDIKQGAFMLFVTDEKSALVWLHNFLNEPKSFSDIHTAFTQLANMQGDEVPDLKELVDQNFIAENGLYRRPKSEPEHNSVLEKREKQLMRHFESLLIQAQTEKKKIKSIRKEAVLLGFEICYKQKRFQDILLLAQKLDKTILEESVDLKEFVDAAEIMLSGIR